MSKPIFKYQGGALTVDCHIEGLTQTLGNDLDNTSGFMSSVEYYGNKYFICETISESAARKFAELLEGDFIVKETPTHAD